jgi:hypothetical protein
MDIEKLKKFEKLPPDVKRELALVMAKWKDKKKESQIRNDFMAFVKHVWPDFVEGAHHKKVAKKFNDIANAKQLMDSPEYKEIFQTRLKEDSQAAGKWETQQGGEYYAAGVGSAITGRGADLLIIDDPHTEQDAMNAQALERTYEWYTSGPRQRLQPGGTIVIVMTRWNEKDLTGRLIKSQKEPKADKWELIEFPAILPSGKPLWPEYWNIKDLEVS